MTQLLKSFFYLLPALLSEKNSLIFINHVKLFLASFIHHHYFKKWEAEKEKQISVMGYKISFFSYPILINQFEEIFIYKSYRFKSAKPSPLIFDCGSNTGISILYFKIFHPGSRIIAFEPDPANFRLLKKNMEQNRFSDITLHHFALGTQEGFCRLYNSQAGEGSMNSSIYANNPEPDFINVSMKKLSSFIDKEIDFMKMDVEGAEGEIIQELSGAGRLSDIRELVMESHQASKLPEDRLLEILKNADLALIEKKQLYEKGKDNLLRFSRVNIH
jgi:FkbM family methyltransferase